MNDYVSEHVRPAVPMSSAPSHWRMIFLLRDIFFIPLQLFNIPDTYVAGHKKKHPTQPRDGWVLGPHQIIWRNDEQCSMTQGIFDYSFPHQKITVVVWADWAEAAECWMSKANLWKKEGKKIEKYEHVYNMCHEKRVDVRLFKISTLSYIWSLPPEY